MDPSLLSPVRVAAKVDALIYAGTVLPPEMPKPRVTFQGADIKAVITNERLKQWNIWQASVSPHRRDALRHLVHRLRMVLDAGD
jgi:sporulation-control protein spo0M